MRAKSSAAWLWWALWMAGSACLQAADSVQVAGVEGIPAEGAVSLLCLQPQRTYSWQEFWECVHRDSLLLLRWAQEHGYWFARLSPQWEAHRRWMRYQLELGEPVRIGAVHVALLPDTPAPVRQQLQWRIARMVGEVASRQRVEELLDTALRVALAAGYPEARADIGGVRLAGTQAELSLVLVLGEPAFADTVLFQGAEQTQQSFLRRWVDIPRDEPVSKQLLQAAQRRLQQLSWIELVEPPRLFRTADGRWGVLFPVRERATARFDGLLGYAPAVGWNGMLQVRLDNLFGTGRSAAVRWYRVAAQLQELLLQYEEPLPPFALVRGRFEMRQQDTLYTETRWEVGLRWLGALASGWWLELVGGWHRLEPSGVSLLAPSLGWYGGLEAELRQLQPRENPIRGVMLRVFSALRWQRVQGAPEMQRGRFALLVDAESFVPVLFPFVIRLHGHGRLLWGTELQREEFYRLGGAQTLRGYREAQFLSPRAVWAGLEGRWLLGKQDHVGAFGELGWIGSAGWCHGLGLQWQLQTAVGVLQLFLAWGRDDQLRQAKLGVMLLDGAL